MFRMIVDLFNAGTDTTATGLSWAILHLIRNPAVQEKCRAEIMQVKPYFNLYMLRIKRHNSAEHTQMTFKKICGMSSVPILFAALTLSGIPSEC